MNWYLQVLKKYAVFNGRSRRKEFWYYILFSLLITIGLVLLDMYFGLFDAKRSIGVLSCIYAVATFLPQTAVAVRRLHDVGKSGWWLWFFAPSDLLQYIFHDNKSIIILIGIYTLIVYFVFLYFMVKNGKAEPNQYGTDPKLDPIPNFINLKNKTI